jgi:hypothetical protein
VATDDDEKEEAPPAEALVPDGYDEATAIARALAESNAGEEAKWS